MSIELFYRLLSHYPRGPNHHIVETIASILRIMSVHPLLGVERFLLLTEDNRAKVILLTCQLNMIRYDCIRIRKRLDDLSKSSSRVYVLQIKWLGINHHSNQPK